MLKKDVYKQYLNYEINEVELIQILDNLQNKKVKEDGVIYTPSEICKAMISFAKPTLEDSILEPSCGHGVFIIHLLEYFSSTYFLKGIDLYNWFIKNVTCIELSLETVIEFKVILQHYFLKHYDILIDTKNLTNIYCQDALKFANKHFNLCIGNPPYIRAKNLETSYLNFLKQEYKSCAKGTIDIYFAFIEKFSKISDRLVFITPNSFLHTQAGKVLKKEIAPNISLLIDFKEFKVFKDANVYTCILKILNHKQDSFLYGNNIEKQEIKYKKDFFSSSENNIKNYETIYSSIATLADRIFLVKKIDNNYYATFNNQKFLIEKEMIVPYLKLTKIKNKNFDFDFMIYPYDINKKIIPEQFIKEKYPLTYKYLLSVKKILNQRDKGNTNKYESWYSYGRKQGLHSYISNEFISIPLMLNSSCIPLKLNLSFLLNEFKTFVFTSGYLVPITPSNEKQTNLLLSNKFLMFAKDNGKPWPGKNESYYTLTSKQIKSFE